ncbi:MAG: sigma-70 family RNA polymerase sigma factor [Bacteroidales bacterium]|nr:sigma-70 family RNA polymerase sigma factor [Bacteroidales bacterium]
MSENNLKTDKAKRDYKLVCAARDHGDEKAYATLMSFYKDALYQMFFQAFKDSAEADDLTMETFGKAFFQLQLYSPTNAFSTWLFAIGTNNLRDRMRLRKRRVETESLSAVSPTNNDETFELPVPSSNRTPEEELIAAQRIGRLRDVVSQLKPSYRRVIEMRYFDELSYEEIADQLQLPMGTVKVHLLRARQILESIIRSQSESL